METVFLGCFLFGALFTVVSVVLGLATAGGDGLHSGHADAGHGSAPAHGPHDVTPGTGTDSGGAHHGLPLLNLSSLLAFLTWFGAVGWLLTRLTAWPGPTVLAAALPAGAAGSAVVSLFLRVVLAGERTMDPATYRLEGTIARVTVGIPEGGTGEIVFTKAGARRSEAARSLSGRAVPRGTEVVVVEYERGVATVQPWSEFIGRDLPEGGGPVLPPPMPGTEKEG
jgi:hypothetical protein